MPFIAGPYTATWNGSALGHTENGFALRVSSAAELITADAYGDSVLDGVYRGGNYFVQVVGLEYSSALTAAFWPYGAFGVHGQAGRLMTAIAAPLVLTATAGTPAANSPATLTASKAILAEGQNLETLLACRLRKLPVLWRLLPYTSSGSTIWFSQT